MSREDVVFRELGGPALFIFVATMFVVIGAACAVGFFFTTPVISVGIVVVVPLVVWLSLMTPYEARVEGSGDVEFIAVRRRRRTNVRAITKIHLVRSGNGRSFAFYWEGGKATMQYKTGRALADYLIGLNPSIEMT